mmetsp:Transcript_22199/g.62992  ORF Transcript_22199/g.62992 Transcript_22199/m.62992 type:complete len:341 (+) Transcript_22199:1120-2142(+)
MVVARSFHGRCELVVMTAEVRKRKLSRSGSIQKVGKRKSTTNKPARQQLTMLKMPRTSTISVMVAAPAPAAVNLLLCTLGLGFLFLLFLSRFQKPQWQQQRQSPRKLRRRSPNRRTDTPIQGLRMVMPSKLMPTFVTTMTPSVRTRGRDRHGICNHSNQNVPSPNTVAAAQQMETSTARYHIQVITATRNTWMTSSAIKITITTKPCKTVTMRKTTKKRTRRKNLWPCPVSTIRTATTTARARATDHLILGPRNPVRMATHQRRRDPDAPHPIQDRRVRPSPNPKRRVSRQSTPLCSPKPSTRTTTAHAPEDETTKATATTPSRHFRKFRVQTMTIRNDS